MLEHDCGASSECSGCEIEGFARALVSSVRAIAYGDSNGPTGLEGLTMAIGGTGGHFDNNNLSTAIGGAGDGIANALSEVADGLNNIADAIRERGPSA